MADFPTLPHTTASQRTIDGGQQVDYAEDGTPRVRSLYAAPAYRFDLELMVTGTQRTALLAHYASEGVDAFAYTWPMDASTYSVRYVALPDGRVLGASDRWQMQVRLEGQAT